MVVEPFASEVYELPMAMKMAVRSCKDQFNVRACEWCIICVCCVDIGVYILCCTVPHFKWRMHVNFILWVSGGWVGKARNWVNQPRCPLEKKGHAPTLDIRGGSRSMKALCV